MLATLDADVAAFHSRELEQWPYVFLDARYDKVRENGRIISKAVLIAVGVTAEGRRQVLGLRVAPREDRDTWSSMLRDLVDRGLQGVRLVVSDAHAGLRQAIESVFTGSSWQRCSIHLMRNLAAEVSHRHRAEVMALIKLVLSSASIEEARAYLRVVLETLSQRHPKAAQVLEAAGEDFLAFMHFPPTHWRKLHSTNLVERLNRELKRRSRVVSIYPNARSLERLSVAVLERVTGTWPGERYISPEYLGSSSSETAALIKALTQRVNTQAA
jgi:transposase-like protein